MQFQKFCLQTKPKSRYLILVSLENNKFHLSSSRVQREVWGYFVLLTRTERNTTSILISYQSVLIPSVFLLFLILKIIIGSTKLGCYIFCTSVRRVHWMRWIWWVQEKGLDRTWLTLRLIMFFFSLWNKASQLFIV